MCTTRAAIGDSQVRVTGRRRSPGLRSAFRRRAPLYAGAEVEPYVAIDPQNASHLIGVWQQDRWSDGGARGLRTGYSFDGGLTWSLTQAAFSRCTGGNAAQRRRLRARERPVGDDRPRRHRVPDSRSRSTAKRSPRLVERGAREPLDRRRAHMERSGDADPRRVSPFNDKESITADPVTPGFAYATWDRLEPERQRPVLVRAHDQRRTVVGSGAPDLRSGRAQPDAQQPYRRHGKRRRAHAVRLLHRVRRRPAT